jgi:hypothetical protein
MLHHISSSSSSNHIGGSGTSIGTRGSSSSSSAHHLSSSSSSSSSERPAAVNLIVNGGFESGNFSGWSLSGSADSGDLVVSGSVDGYTAYAGQYFALLGASGSNSVLSSNVTVAAGAAYKLSFALASDGKTTNDLSAVVTVWPTGAATTLFSETNIPATVYVVHSAVFSAPTGSGAVAISLSFLSRDDPGYLALDDVSLVLL